MTVSQSLRTLNSVSVKRNIQPLSKRERESGLERVLVAKIQQNRTSRGNKKVVKEENEARILINCAA